MIVVGCALFAIFFVRDIKSAKAPDFVRTIHQEPDHRCYFLDRISRPGERCVMPLEAGAFRQHSNVLDLFLFIWRVARGERGLNRLSCFYDINERKRTVIQGDSSLLRSF